MTHADLVQRAALWLAGTMRCGIVLTEFASAEPETPDVLGFTRGGDSVLVECKTNRADFLRDRRKPSRAYDARGLGQRRYYFCEPGVIRFGTGELDLTDGWGLATVSARVRVVVHPIPRPDGVRLVSEHRVLYSLGRRCVLGECWRPLDQRPAAGGEA